MGIKHLILYAVIAIVVIFIIVKFAKKK